MRRYLLDTGSASDYINRRGGVFSRAGQRRSLGDRIGICTPVLGELWAGIEQSRSRPKNLKTLVRNLPDFRIWPFDQAAAEEFGRVFANLKRLGRPMQQIDMQIAAVALSMGNCTVVTKDSDFSAIPGLDVVDWST
jgi:tRNA(fMet)-specific endonuclease VapC